MRLLLTAVDLKLPMATYFLVNTILRRKKDKTSFVLRPEFAPAIRDLEGRASGGEDRIAIILWGRMLMARGDDDQAMEVFRQAVELDNERDGHLEDDVPDEVDERLIRGSSLGQAYLHLGRWHLKRHRPESLTEAESYLRVAAEQYDDAEAWLEVAKLLLRRSSVPPSARSKHHTRPGTSPSPSPSQPSSSESRQTVSTASETTVLPSPSHREREERLETCLLAAARHGKQEAARLLVDFYRTRCENDDARSSSSSSSRRTVGQDIRATQQEQGPSIIITWLKALLGRAQSASVSRQPSSKKDAEDEMWAREWDDLVNDVPSPSSSL